MGWREDVKLGIARISDLYLGTDNGNLGAQMTASASELNSLDVSAALQSAEHGAGAISTAFAPRTYRYTDRGHILTEIHVDLTGLAVTGTAQGGAIGLSGIDACYIGRYVLATYGNVYKINMICVETPTEETATFEQDIDLCYTTAADVQAGEDVDVDIIAAARDWVVGEHATNIVPKLTPDGDYLYLAAGDTAGDTGEYSGGQFIIQFFGHAVIS